MGKKSRRNRGSEPGSASTSATSSAATSSADGNVASTNSSSPMSTLYYPSDGPSDVELLQTTSTSLQTKLDLLTQLGLANRRREFVEQFVPLDLNQTDIEGYYQDLTTSPESEGQWTNLIAEIAAIRSGKGVDRIEGDQINKAIFYFRHPLLEQCDREVVFVNTNGEWRAEG